MGFLGVLFFFPTGKSELNNEFIFPLFHVIAKDIALCNEFFGYLLVTFVRACVCVQVTGFQALLAETHFPSQRAVPAVPRIPSQCCVRAVERSGDGSYVCT